MSQNRAYLWQPTKFKFLGKIVSGGTPESGKPEYWDGPVTWLTPVDLGKDRNDAIRQSGRTITEKGVKAAGLAMLPSGTIVISTRAPIGSVGLLAREAATNQGCKALVPRLEKLDSRFGFYYSLNAVEKLQSLGLGTTFVELSTYALKNLTLNSPPLDIQQLIASYLDEQTAKIDQLMDMRRRQIELLKEQRAALIQQVVTRGLNPNAQMKDSGIEWLGEIPSHWKHTRLKYVCSHIVDCLHSTPNYSPDGEYPAIRTADVKPGEIDIQGAKRLLYKDYIIQIQRLVPQEGDIVYSREGERFGIAACVPAGAELCISQRMMHFRVRKRYNSFFVMWLLNTPSVYSQALVDVIGATSPHVNVGTITNFVLALPPRTEQDSIVAFIDSETSKINEIITSYSRQLTLLAGYRAALIHECVTGQRQVPDIPASVQEEAYAL